MSYTPDTSAGKVSSTAARAALPKAVRPGVCSICVKTGVCIRTQIYVPVLCRQLAVGFLAGWCSGLPTSMRSPQEADLYCANPWWPITIATVTANCAPRPAHVTINIRVAEPHARAQTRCRWQRTHPLQALQVLQLRLELVQVGVRVAAQHAAVQRVPEHLRTRSSQSRAIKGWAARYCTHCKRADAQSHMEPWAALSVNMACDQYMCSGVD